ncbi:S-2-hydroxy-acid oxidase [Pseudomassariella vexata]|uniref:Oxidase FUB9 n=1 Tax=Pseudomassariella vexata TaxID=1141098 RepID=A0A1Y2DJU7_9PEZI|nr:S-2-hydroxy-acid oxidase [Pseudomassariella vexata]ORY59510.1 S-2-hydroxy-acid oxidase [Pseudomassariella vexata]
MSGGAPLPVPVKGEDIVILNIDDIKKTASKNLPVTAREFFNSGSTYQTTIAENSAAFDKYRLRSRVLVDVSSLNTSTTCLGQPIKFPLCIAPAGLQAMAHPDGELATARACSSFGVNMGISSYANYSTGDITAAGGHGISYAMQLYPMRNRQLQERIIQRAEAAGCKAILLTGDSPVLGVRYNEWRNDFRTPEGLSFPNLERTSEVIRETTHDSGFMQYNDDSHSWARDIAWLRGKTKMQIWIKGILTAEDTNLAIRHGCDGIIVSNHGGRQLDGAPATLDALLECVEAARGRIPVHMDGGIRRGSDIFVALALGAECVWVGRPVIWGLAYKGQEGVEKVLQVLYEDFRRCMALCGCRGVEEITRDCLARMTADGLLVRCKL